MSFTLNRRSPLARGLVAWYSFSDQPMLAKNLALAAQGGEKQNPLTVNVGATTGIDKFGSPTRVFNGTSSYMRATGKLALRDWPFTLGCWFTPAALSGNRILIYCGATTTNVEWGLLGVTGAKPFMERRTSSTGETGDTHPDSLVVGKEQFVASVSTLTRGEIYHNYSFSGTPDTDVKVAPQTAWNTFSLGRLDRSSPNWYFNGSISHVFAWNRVLSESELQYMEHPNTRWDLFQPLDEAVYVRVPGAIEEVAASGRIMSSLVGGGGLVGSGGIAGKSGGLAA